MTRSLPRVRARLIRLLGLVSLAAGGLFGRADAQFLASDPSEVLGGFRNGPEDEVESSPHQFFEAWSRGEAVDPGLPIRSQPLGEADAVAAGRPVAVTRPIRPGPRRRPPPTAVALDSRLAAPAVPDTRSSWFEPLQPQDPVARGPGPTGGALDRAPGGLGPGDRQALRARVARRWGQLTGGLGARPR